MALVGHLLTACDSQFSEETVLAIYALRSRATCKKEDSDLAAAGRSSVVADMFDTTANVVRDLWTRKIYAETTRPHWTDNEALRHACDKVITVSARGPMCPMYFCCPRKK